MGPPSERSIFLAALDRGPRERQAFLAEACAGDPHLRAEIEELLCAHERPDNLLDEIPLAVRAVRNRFEAEPSEDRVVREGSGTTIGPYRLLEQIGEGGFGLVFVAEQQRPVKRRVAVKLIKPGMDTREVLTRFEQEYQALALMDHPNIARVLDAGQTDAGRPYFVMELVRGIHVTEFCDQSRLTLRDRLALFIHVCQAVQHAHQKGVIHRDLKPSNVLVTQHDGAPVVKVIDFGVAKAVGQVLTEKTIYTRFAQMIGTPLYMSPEQAELSGLDVDTRSDIYSLGVLLYELLTGSTPFDGERLRTTAFDEVRRIIREEEPPRPSTRLSTPGAALETVSARRNMEPRKLSAFVRGDLDWIVMKALEKDRKHRYETAEAFAQDVRRFLDEEPVEARPPSSLYRFRKFARRNRMVLTTGALVAAALVLGTVVSVWQAVLARSAQAEADAARHKAEDFAERLKAANLLLDSARVHTDEERWADAWADCTRAAELQPDHYLVWSRRGALHLRVGLWKRAADDYARAMDLGASANSPGWWGVPQLLLYAGDEKRYREACNQLLQQQEKPEGFATAVMVRSCTISPAGVGNPADLARRAEKLLAMPAWPGGPRFPGGGAPPRAFEPFGDGPGRPPGPPRGMAFHFRSPGLYTAGLAHYRAGQYEQAIKRLRSSLSADSRWPSRALAYPILAMSYHRTARADRAHEALASAEKTISQWTDEMVQGRVGAMPVPWFEWLECLLLYREARILVVGSPPHDDSRLEALQRRAEAAVHRPGS